MHPDSLLSACAIALLLGISVANAGTETDWGEVLRVGLPLCMAVVVAVFYWLRRKRPGQVVSGKPRSMFMVGIHICLRNQKSPDHESRRIG